MSEGLIYSRGESAAPVTERIVISLERRCSGDRATARGSSYTTVTRMLLNAREPHSGITVSLQVGPLGEDPGKDRADGRRPAWGWKLFVRLTGHQCPQALW